MVDHHITLTGGTSSGTGGSGGGGGGGGGGGLKEGLEQCVSLAEACATSNVCVDVFVLAGER